MQKIKSVVIDDESSNRTLIINLIQKLNPNYEILGEADDLQSGYNLIELIKPQVVFLDIRMPGGTGFQLIEMFEDLTFDIVFISGFDAYALKAFEFNAIDYVLKPINTEKFAKTLRKVQLNIESKDFQNNSLKSIVESYDPKLSIMTKIPIHSGRLVRLLNINELLFIKSQEGCTSFKLVNGEKFTSSKQFDDFDFIFEKYPSILRINKSVFVNVNMIVGYTKGTMCQITLNDGSSFEISRRKKSEVLEILAKSVNE